MEGMSMLALTSNMIIKSCPNVWLRIHDSGHAFKVFSGLREPIEIIISNEVTMSIETIIHRIMNDTAFARAMVRDPDAALEAHGLEVAPEELNALMSVLSKSEGSDLISGAVEDPNEWFAPQFKSATADPNEWFEAQFRSEIA
jgi:hypothetical protein